MKAKGAIAGMLFVGFVLFIVSCVTVSSGLANITNGIYSSGCATAGFLQDLLVGGQGFIGLIPVADQFELLEARLTVGSTFFNELQAKMDETEVLDGAVALASKTVSELKNALDFAKEMAATEKHGCQVCDELGEQLLPSLIDLLDNGVGSALVDARAEVSKQLQGQEMEELSSNFQSAVTPLRSIKDSMTSTIGWFVTPGGLDEFTYLFQGQASPLGLMVVYACLCLGSVLACGLCSLGFWHFKEKKEDCPAGENPHRKLTPMCSRCTWCNSLILVMNLFLIGGIIMMLTVPISGLCLYLLDLDGPLLEKSAEAMGIDLGSDSDQVITIIDRCLSVKAAEKYGNESSNLMDILVFENESTGEIYTMREKVITTAIEPVNAAFAEIDNSLQAAGSAELSSEPALTELRNVLASIDVSATMLPKEDKMSSDATYEALFSDQNLGVESMKTSVNCNNGDVTVDGISLDKTNGMDTYVTYVTTGAPSLGTASGSCAARTQSVSCSDSTDAECLSVNALLSLKNSLRNKAFECNLFTDQYGHACDPKKMTYDTATKSWSGVCLDSQGKVSVYSGTCNGVDALDAYVKDFDLRLKQVIAYLDWEVVDKLEAVNTGMKDVVTNNIVDPVYAVVEEFGCAFMRDFWSGLLDGFCYRGANGFAALGSSYVIGAFTAIVIAIAGYVTFRLAQDNMDVWEEREAAPETQSETI